MKTRYRLIFQVIAFIGLVISCQTKANAQFSLITEGNLSSVRENISIENKEPLLGYGLGVSFQYYPFKKLQKLSIINEIKIKQKGYQQQLEEKYSFKFKYIAMPILANYSLSEQVAIQSGIELSKLIDTNVKQGTKTYNNFDLGLVAGVSFFNKHRISGYSRLTYGLLPMLDYYNIDELGNFKNEIHDLKNISFSVGIKITLHNEKIQLYR